MLCLLPFGEVVRGSLFDCLLLTLVFQVVDICLEFHGSDAHSLLGGISQRFFDNFPHLRTCIARQMFADVVLVEFDLLVKLSNIPSLIQRFAMDHLIEHDPECPAVTLFAVQCFEVSFRGHIGRGANVEGLHDFFGLDDLAEAEVDDNWFQVSIHDNVGGFEVSMDDAGLRYGVAST